MKWIEATGGPVVLIARDDVPLWTGHEGDYDRACEVAVKGVQRVFEISDYIEAQALRRALLDFKLDCPDAAETLASESGVRPNPEQAFRIAENRVRRPGRGAREKMA